MRGANGMKRKATLIPERYLDNEQAAQYLKLSPRTLDRQRLTGEGPQFRKFGRRVVYAIEDLEAWANERIFGRTRSHNGQSSQTSPARASSLNTND
jgi:predicted DNA-binding transcriptional regulator AlpA